MTMSGYSLGKFSFYESNHNISHS